MSAVYSDIVKLQQERSKQLLDMADANRWQRAYSSKDHYQDQATFGAANIRCNRLASPDWEPVIALRQKGRATKHAICVRIAKVSLIEPDRMLHAIWWFSTRMEAERAMAMIEMLRSTWRDA